MVDNVEKMYIIILVS